MISCKKESGDDVPKFAKAGYEFCSIKCLKGFKMP